MLPAYSRPNNWFEWAEIFCGHSEVAEGGFRLKIKTGKVNFLPSITIHLKRHVDSQLYNIENASSDKSFPFHVSS